ncbi:ferredoxin [Streptococcus sp. X16XC17]|uniref:ferredoxin n=1 Tax=unclassified Streptococcus TaxID=2608887 RepID=UPI00066FCE93|nr:MULTISPECIES: ferredoxin [unclassified Streptococcus]TCD46508.1 ferredoxin [Streptococcus sp. X16XC17]
MNIKLLPEKCIAYGLCQTYSKEFDYDDDDDGIVVFANHDGLEANFPDDADLLLASKSCPTKAILSD